MEATSLLDRVLRIRVAPDGRKAVIEVLPYEDITGKRVLMEDVKFHLEMNGIRNGINWSTIAAALSETEKTKKAAFNIEAAVCAPLGPVITIPKYAKSMSYDAFLAWTVKLADITKLLIDEKVFPADEFMPFYLEDETIVQWSLNSHLLDVHGVPFHDDRDYLSPKLGNGVASFEKEGVLTIKAKTTGYLSADGINHIGIKSPVCRTRADNNLMRMEYLIAPVSVSDVDSMLKHLHDSTIDKLPLAAQSVVCKMYDQSEIRRWLLSGKVRSIVIRSDRSAVESVDARLVVSVRNRMTPSKEIDRGSVSHRDESPFQEVAAGTMLAVKHKAIAGVDGVDIDGKIIPSGRIPVDMNFSIGKNIRIEEQDDRIIYFAAITGVLEFSETLLNVDDVLKVKDNVDSHTGNIRYSRDVSIMGNISAGFSVECGGSLTVNGNIEQGALVSCSGDLIVRHGIFGEETRVIVSKGNAEIGFLQNSSIHVNGNLVINGFSYLSTVFCKGELRVLGKKDIGNKSSVIGGRLNSMNSMDLHSVGSISSKTELFCGMNAGVIEKLNEIKLFLPVLTRKIVQMQQQLGINIKQAEITEIVSHFSSAKKALLKEKLTALKSVTEQREELSKTSEQLKLLAFAVNIDSLTVRIHRQLIPPIHIKIGESHLWVTEERNDVVFQIENGAIA